MEPTAHLSLQSHRQCPQHLEVLKDGTRVGASLDAEVKDSLGQSEFGPLLLVPLQEDCRSSRTQDSVDNADGSEGRVRKPVHDRVEPAIS